MHQTKHLFAALALFLLLPSIAASQGIDYATARLSKRISPLRIAEEQIALDGVLNESVWEQAPMVNEFFQSDPNEGEPASQKTEVRIVYDSENLYIGVVAYDNDIDKMIVNDIKKDYVSTESDAFGFILDTFHDLRNGFLFITNPRGGRFDGQTTNESELNSNWDGVWFVKTRILDYGWIAEIRLPFKTLKFSDAPVQTWGINLLRRTRRRNEDSYWAPLPRIYRHLRVSMAGTLEGLESIQPASNLRMKPYVFSSFGQFREPARTRNEFKGDAGFDLKYAFGSALTLDATVNTDFSQVEADEQQVNLTRFSLFFPEKREFFLENAGIFSFGTLTEFRPPGSGARTTGRQSSGNEDLIFFFSRRVGLSNDGREIPILGGTRLTGRKGPWSVGFLNIQTRKLDPTPSTNFAVVRVKRNILKSSQVGAIFINKDERESQGFNRGYGLDANLRFGEVYSNLYYARTHASGASKTDNESYRYSFAFRNRSWDLQAIYTDIGANFRPDVGFAPRIGVKKFSNSLAYKARPAWKPRWIREFTPTVNDEFYWNSTNRVESRYVDTSFAVAMQDGGVFDVGRNTSFERLFRPFRLQSSVSVPVGDYSFNDVYVSYNTSPAKRLGPNLRYQTGDFYSGQKTSYTVGGQLRYNYHLTINGAYTRNNIDLREATFSTDLVTARFNYSFTTAVFLNALIQYNTDARQWSSNVRFDILHRPLSDLFVVYNERRDTTNRTLIDRALIAKFTYMFEY